MNRVATGEVVDRNGYFWVIKSGDHPQKFFNLTPGECFKEIKLGDIVRLEYRTSPGRGRWQAAYKLSKLIDYDEGHKLGGLIE